MRQTQIFAGSSHPQLVESICERLGSSPAEAELGKFSNGETKVQLNTSIRDQDVFIVQSGSNKINDNVMELLIMVSACKSGSAKSITAVMPYFPYSRQSKKKSHRGSITARMIANLLNEAGVNHVITLDLHANQMQGFFHCPVDNLLAEPLIAQWIKMNIRDWRRAVVVSKNPGGTKRVTSLADALKLNFGIVMTDRRRPGSGRASMSASVVLETAPTGHEGDYEQNFETFSSGVSGYSAADRQNLEKHSPGHSPARSLNKRRAGPSSHAAPDTNLSPLRNCQQTDESSISELMDLTRIHSEAGTLREHDEYSSDDDTDSRKGDVITGRLVHGHIVDDEAPSPALSHTAFNGNIHTHEDDEAIPEHMISSFHSTVSSMRTSTYVNTAMDGLGGSGDAVASSDDEDEHLRNPELESTVTLVGNVRDRPVFIVDDMIDKSTSWIAAAETVVKRGGATTVYCFATHGLFGDDALQEMEDCDCIDRIVVTNAFPIPDEKQAKAMGKGKLRVLDVSALLAEAIRRNHHGESIEQLYMHYD